MKPDLESALATPHDPPLAAPHEPPLEAPHEPLLEAPLAPSLETRLDLSGERRTVAILHADICGFTRIAEQLNPEQTKLLIDALFKVLTREIRAQDGTVDSYIGDAVLAVFGLSEAHGDDIRRAADAALAMHRALEQFSHPLLVRLGARLRMRIGIDAGPVIVGQIGALQRNTVTGATVAAAMVLEQLSPPGGTLVGETARDSLSAHYRLSPQRLPSGRLAYQLHETILEHELESGLLADPEPETMEEEGAEAGTLPEEQLRQVTVLFALLSDFQGIVEQYDPKELRDLLDGCFRILTAEVQARDGTIDKYMADSMLALFGAPVAHEDDPDRAVSAALGMLDALESWNRRLFETRGIRISLKIGINTGKVLVGYVGSEAQATVMGDVVNTASRVEHAAPLGGILICESTRRGLADRFRVRAQPPLKVKGKSQPLTVFRVVRGEAEAGEEVFGARQAPLIGRDREFEQLAACWRQLVRPETPGHGLSERLSERPPGGLWVTLLGDVGLGTDRLLREFRDYAASDPCQPRILEIRGAPFADEAGAEVLRRLLESLAGIDPAADGAERAARFLALAQTIAGTDAETGEVVRAELVARSISRLAGLRLPADPDEGIALQDPTRARRLGMTHLLAVCAKLTAERPMLILATELQWAEEAALDMLEALGNAPPERLMLLTAARPTLLDRRPTWGQGNAEHLRITLEPLDLRDTQAFVRALTGEREPVPSAVIENLHRFTGGNPFYLTESLRYYLESRAGGRSVDELGVPDSIEGVLQSRLDRLSFEEGLTLRAAAVIGPTFWRSAVAAVLGNDRGEVLEQLRARGFVSRREPSTIPGEEEYRFEHVLTARVADGNLLESVRQRYHLAAAEWLVDRSAGEARFDLRIAQHLEAAGASGRAAPYYARAGDRALAAYDCAEAIRLFDRALSVPEEEGEAALQGEVRAIKGEAALQGEVRAIEGGAPRVQGPALLRGQGSVREGLTLLRAAASETPGPALLRAHLLAQRGEARRMRVELEGALVDFHEAAMASIQVGDLVGAGSAWYRAGLVYLSLGAHEPALRAADTGDRLLQGLSAPVAIVVGLQLRAELSMARGVLEEAREPIEQALVLWRRSGDRWGLAQSLHAFGRLLLGQSDYPAAGRVLREALSIRETLGDAHGLANTLHNLGVVADSLGHFPEALGHYHRSLRLNRRLENRSGMAATLMNQGVGYLRCGYLGRARAALEESLELHKGLEKPWGIGACQGNLGHFWLQLGRTREASDALNEAVLCFRGLGDEEGEGEFLIDLALCRLMEGAIDDAEQLVTEGFSRVRRKPGGTVEALALQLSGTIALTRGALKQARELIEELEWNDAAQVLPELRMKTALLAGRVALAGSKHAAALAALENAETVARAHDMAPGRWEARWWRHRVLREAGMAATEAVEREAQEAFKELLARVEDPALTALMESRTTPPTWLPGP